MNELLIIIPELVLDGTGAPPQRNLAVVVKEERIADLVTVATLPNESSARRIHLPKATLLPGIIDAHVHLTLGDGATPRQTMMSESDEMLLLRAAAQAHEALRAGITTLRDCGGRGDVTFLLREGIRRGATRGPRLHLCGTPLTPPRGHCYFMRGEVEGKEDIVKRIGYLAERGADFIKVMATGGGLTPGTNSLAMQFSHEDLKFIVSEAARHNLPVAAHAHSTESIQAAAEVGASLIEHASFIGSNGIHAGDGIIRLLAEWKTILVPTNIPAVNAVRSGRTLGLARELGMASTDFLAHREEVVRTLLAGGVRLIAGTDAGATGVHFTDVFGEIELLAQAGMSNAQAIAAATGDSAESLRLGYLGRIAPHHLADLVAVSGDAAADLDALRDPVLVILAGSIVRENRE